MFNRYFIPFLLGSVILSTGCSVAKPVNNHSSLISWNDLQVTPSVGETLCWDISLFGDKPSWEQVKRDFRAGLVMKLEIPDAKEIGYQTYEIPSVMPLVAELHFWYGEENSRQANIRLFTLLDEQQVDVFTSKQFYYDVTIPIGSEVIVPLQIPPLSSGIHDLVIVGIPYVDEYPNPEGIVRVLNHRITLVVPPITFPFRQINFVMLPAQGLLSRGEPKIPLMLSLRDEDLKVWNWPNEWLNTETDVVEFFVIAGYENTVNLDAPDLTEPEYSFFALTFFVDYQQVNVEADKLAIYGKVSNDTAYTSNRINIDLEEGKHHILVIRINNPGIPMCILYGPPGGRILPFDVIGSLHGVNVSKSNK